MKTFAGKQNANTLVVETRTSRNFTPLSSQDCPRAISWSSGDAFLNTSLLSLCADTLHKSNNLHDQENWTAPGQKTLHFYNAPILSRLARGPFSPRGLFLPEGLFPPGGSMASKIFKSSTRAQLVRLHLQCWALHKQPVTLCLSSCASALF